MKRLWCIISVLLGMAHEARADGGFFHAEAGVGYSADQQAILVFDPEAGRETMILSTGQDWDDPNRKADYAWVVPVPSLMREEDFTLFEEGEEAFERLYHLTEPSAFFSVPGGCGCVPAGPGDASELAGVTELVSFEMDEYEIHVLSAEDSPKLQNWLQERGYAFPSEAVPVLQYYINKDWYFTAVKIGLPQSAEEDGVSKKAVAQPSSKRLQMTFDTPRCVYPLHISSVSSRAGKHTGILLYVFAPYRVWARNFITLQMTKPARTYSTVEEFQTVYREEFADLLETADGRAFVTEYAEDFSDSYHFSYALKPLHPLLDQHNARFLTRLRTELLPEDMDADVAFIRAPSDSSFEISARIKPSGNPHGGHKTQLAVVSGLVLFFVLTMQLPQPMRRRLYLAGMVVAMLVL